MSVVSIRAGLKSFLIALLGRTIGVDEKVRRFFAFAYLRATMQGRLDSSVRVLGRVDVHGTRRITLGKDLRLYREVHLETWGNGSITIGDHVLLSRGVHVVSLESITIGEGTMIGEYTSIRDADHRRIAGKPLRDGGHSARAIEIGAEVWIGRGVTVLSGVHIGDGATVGANAVVTRDVPPGVTVVGVPARPIEKGI
jgi:acetyltransferase-like isoleucine patch superfamily enzyme